MRYTKIRLSSFGYFDAEDDAEDDDCDNSRVRMFETRSRKASGFSTFAKYCSAKKKTAPTHALISELQGMEPNSHCGHIAMVF